MADGRIFDIDSLSAYLQGRLHTVALTEAALAAALVLQPLEVDRLDAEADARITVPELRAVSRQLGRRLIRVAEGFWPHPLLAVLPDQPHQPLALGAVGVAAGIDAPTVAALAIHHATLTPAQSALRLLGLDPFAVAALTAAMLPDCERVAIEAVRAAAGPLEDLPARNGPIVDIAAASHASLSTRLFAS